MTPDPIGLLGGINPYIYASNNPINRIDSKGLSDVATVGNVVARAAGNPAVLSSLLSIAYACPPSVLLTGSLALGYVAGTLINDYIIDPLIFNEDAEDVEGCETKEQNEEAAASPPEGLLENPDRPGSWGEYDENGKFQEKWRLDKGRPEVKKGHRARDHIHLDGKKKWYPIGE